MPCYATPGNLKDKESDRVAEGVHIPADTPPVFLTHASDDSESEVAHSVIAYLGLHRAGVPAELHVYASGEHDFGVRRDGKLPSSWPQLCLDWLRSLGLYDCAVRLMGVERQQESAISIQKLNQLPRRHKATKKNNPAVSSQ